MPETQDIQTDFSGGANNRVDAELLGINQFVSGQNVEVRDGGCRTRRGSFRLFADVTGEDFQGAGIFRSIVGDIPSETIIVAQDNKLKRIVIPEVRQEITPLPDTEQSNEFTFIQALENIYIFRGEGYAVWKWTTNPLDAIETLVPPVSPLEIMPGSNVVLYEYNRFWIVTDDDTLNISDLLDEGFNPNNAIKINQGKDGQKVVGLHPFPGGALLAFKERSIAILQNASGSLSSLTQEFIDNEFGLVSKDAIVSVGKDVWFLSSQGVMSIRVNEQQKNELISVPISADIEQTMLRMNLLAADKSQATLFDNYVIFSFPIDGSDTPDTMIVYDLINRAWLDQWTGHNPRRFIEARINNRDRLYYVNDLGGLIQLQSGLYKDFEHSNRRYLEFHDASSTQTVDISSILSGTDEIATQAAGWILMNIRLLSDTDGAIFTAFDSATNTDYIRIYMEGSMLKAQLVDGGTTQWEIETDKFILNRFFLVNLIQDGASPYLTVNGEIVPQTQTVTTDLTAWFDDITEDEARVGSNDTQGDSPSIAPEDAFDGDMEFIEFLGSTGLDDIKANFPMNEGTGTTITDTQNSKTGTFGSDPDDPDWNTPLPDPDDIVFKILTRRFTFGVPQVPKTLSQSELRFLHRNPNLSLDLFTNIPFVENNMIVNKVYSQLKYMIAGKADWDPTNVNNDHDDPYREDYAPLDLSTPTITMPGDSASPNGIRLEVQQEHTEFFNDIIISPNFQLEIENTQGTISLKSITMTGKSKAFAGEESMAI